MFKYDIEYQNDARIWVPLRHWIRPIMNKSTLDETHDETQIFLSCSPITTPFKPFTKFIINITEYDDNGAVVNVDTLYRVVIADEIKQVVFEETEDDDGNIVDGLYDHDIRLAEATKELERYTVDNLSFTNEWRKAFSTSGSNAYISNQVLSSDFWDNSPTLVSDAGGIYITYYLLRIQNGGNLTQASIKEDSYVARQLYVYDLYKIEELKSTYLNGNQITIPSVSYINANDSVLATSRSQISLGNYTDHTYYAQYNNYNIKIKIKYPNGTTEEVTQGQQINLTQTGKYSIEYEITRNVRVRTFSKSYILWIPTGDGSNSYSRWFNGLTTYMTQEFAVVDNEEVRTTKLTIHDILTKLVQVTPTSFESASNLFVIDESVKTRYGDFEAPEMIFTNKNLWEALREIGGVINAIPYLKINNKETWNNIAYLPLSSEEQVSDEVEEEYCNSTSYYDSENYTASYDLSVDNMINPLADYEGVVHEQGWYIGKTIRSEEVEISETSMNIETVYPIYTINHVWYVDMSKPDKKYALDLFVYEYALYQTLVSNNQVQGKAIAMYYTQGKPNINGLNYKVSKDEYAAAENVVSIRHILQAVLGLSQEQAQALDLKNCRFIVEYTPYLNARIKYYKTNAPRLNIKTSMFQNQSANVVDARALGRKMVANIGRVGNLGYVDSLKVYSLSKIPLKGQRSIDGYFVSTVTTEYDQHHLLSSVQYTKDYQKISDFINIQNLQRFYEVSERQSVHRYINPSMFYIFGDNVAEINKQNGLNQANNYPQVNYLASLFVDQGYNRKINASILKAYAYDDNNELQLVSNIYLNSNAIATGNTISIITDYYDNYGAGYQAKKYNDDTNAYMNKSVPYSNKQGRIAKLTIQNVTDSNINYGDTNATLEENMKRLGLSLPAITNLDEDNIPTGSEYLVVADNYENNNMPTVSNVGCYQTIFTDKDSREILHYNQQHHFLTNDISVIVGSAMTEYCRFIQDRPFTCRLVFLKNKIDTYEFKIKPEDIIQVNIDSSIPQTSELADLCTQITNANLNKILSTTNNTDALYIQPMLNNQGFVFGLNENARAWAIITDNNELIIGRNEEVQSGINGSLTKQINMSVTSDY